MVWRPYSETGYIDVHGGKTPDPNSNRQKTIIEKEKGGKVDKGRKNKGDGKGPKADSQPFVESPQPTVQKFPPTHSIDNKICALYGTDLRRKEMV